MHTCNRLKCFTATSLTRIGGKRSPYSASVCPGLHLWIHSAGCVLGSTRSQYAVYVETGSAENIILGACITGIMLSKSHDQVQRVITCQEARAAIIQGELDAQAQRLKQEEENPDEERPDSLFSGIVTYQH